MGSVSVSGSGSGSGSVSVLDDLIHSLQGSLALLRNGKEGREIQQALHDDKNLPEKELYDKASRAVDLLHDVQQLLQPSTLVLADHFLGYTKTKCLCAAVELGVPEILRDGPRNLAQIAQAGGARPDRLGQVLRMLVNHGVFAWDGATGCFSNNRASTLLLRDHWTQWHNWVDLYGNQFYDIARGIPASCKAGSERNAAQHNFAVDADMFTYFQDQGWVPQLHKTLSGGAVAQAPGILADYPWAELENSTILDVGGGAGGLIALVLRAHPTIRGGILDLDRVIEQARANFHSPGGIYEDVGSQVDKANLVAGDFMKEIPAFEIYTMKWCLHDWDDSKAITVLTNIRKAITITPRSRLVILESILADGRMGHLTGYADINMMMTAPSGNERDEHQWRNLARQTGWGVRSILPLRNSWPCAIELIPAATIPTSITKVEGSSSTNGERLDIAHRFPPPPQNEPITSEAVFLEPWDQAKKGGNPFIRSSAAVGYERTNISWVTRPIKARDARPFRDEFALDTHGFAYADDPVVELAPGTLGAIQNNDKARVEAEYYPRVIELLKARTGASRVIIFDHTVRRRNPTRDRQYNAAGQEQPATMVHCDQSAPAALKRLAQNLGPDESVDDLVAAKRVQMINVWRPLNGPVEDWPLGTMDYRSLRPEEQHDVDLWAGVYDNHRQTMTFEHNDSQEWWYLHGHRTDEVTLIKIWDSRPGEGAKLCAHVAFKHPDTPVDAPPRQSVEVRCFVVLDS